MPRDQQYRGVIAALLLPRDDEGRPAWDDFERNARFVLRAGVAGLCVNGATGEFAGATQEERGEAVARARQVVGASGVVVTGIGATRWTEILTLARDGEEAGADALLVPAPHFFRYEPGDLAEFYRRIAAEVRVPVFIYNLPAFTGGLEPCLALELIREVRGIAGVKDSSGRLDLFEELAAGAGGDAVALVGNDAVLADALRRGICDGTISGVAGVLPEITLALWRTAQLSEWELLARVEARLRSLLEHLDAFPTPWGLKLVAVMRGLSRASFPLPLSAERRAQADAFRSWFPAWWREAEADLAKALNLEANPDLCTGQH
jgi:4-hydroxy-tetrahydrodipicolinate synthase